MLEELEIDMGTLARFNTSTSANAGVTQTSYSVEYVIPPPPVITAVAYEKRRMICFDQAMANTGWVVIETDPAMGMSILMMHTIHTTPRPDKLGWEDTLDRAAEVFSTVYKIMSEWQPSLVVHELPPIGNGPYMRRTDSSIVAATAVRCASSSWGIPVQMVSAQTAKKFFTGDRNAKKKLVQEALKERYGPLLKDPAFQLNEHTYDALALGCYLLETDDGTN